MFFHKFDLSMSDISNLPDKITNLNSIDINELSDPGGIQFLKTIPKFKFLSNNPSVNINASIRLSIYLFLLLCLSTPTGTILRLKNPEKEMK